MSLGLCFVFSQQIFALCHQCHSNTRKEGMRGGIPLIPELRSQRQANLFEFGASLVYKENSRTTGTVKQRNPITNPTVQERERERETQCRNRKSLSRKYVFFPLELKNYILRILFAQGSRLSPLQKSNPLCQSLGACCSPRQNTLLDLGRENLCELFGSINCQ